MLKVTGLNKSYGKQLIFEDVSFVVNKGERIGLVGRNGHGKSTLFKLILKEEEPDSGVISIPRHYTIGHLSQHIRFTENTVLKEACLSLPKSEDGVDESYKVETILSGLGLTEDYFGLSPMELSGGYQIRLNLAKALAAEPDLLLLDEPTNYLDIISVRWLKKFLKNWKNEFMIITHDRDFMDSVTTHTIAIHRNRVRKISGPTEKLYAQILMEEDIHEQTRSNEEKKRKDVEKFINRFRASATKASAVQSRIKALEKKEKLEKLENIKTLDFEFNSAPFLGKWLMEIKDISVGYSELAPLLIEGLTVAVGKKDRIGIIGKNGKGKTTLLNTLAGEMNPLSGEISRHQSLKVAYFGQTNIERLNLQNTIEKEIMEAHPDYNRGFARRICGAMMFEGDAALKKIEVLSGGERSRVLLGKLLVSPANLLMLDEPTNHLDMESIDSLIEAIDAFDGAMMIVTHSELILSAIATRLIVFDKGQVTLFEGTYADFLEKVGWSNEAAETQAVAKPKENKSMNRKELRKLRADLLAEKAKVLGPLKKKVEQIEDMIVNLEKAAEAASAALLQASEKGETDAITLHSKTYHEARNKIDSSFDELERLTAEIDSKSKEYEVRLSEME
ncbi:MAG: ABC-F family ATP-binding cassette domain-containing protein [Deltaproteobacteria bacterium]|nr:ABC-F family ATP-binding cassette domain-containing protein [Deltaproteobacteria bacterium]